LVPEERVRCTCTPANYNLVLTAIVSFRQNNRIVRVSGILILTAMVLMVFSPLTVRMSVTPESDIKCLVTLDVCHAGDSAGSVHSDLPAFCENTFSLDRPESLQFIEPRNSLPLFFNVPFQEELPPKV